MDTEGYFPTNYAILKLYASSLLCALMVFWYTNNAPISWKISSFVFFVIRIDESAQIHEVLGAGVATKLFGNQLLSGPQYTIIPYALTLGSFYFFSLTLFPRISKMVFLCFVLSGVSFILSQAVEWAFAPALDIILNFFATISPLTGRFDMQTLMFAWDEGLEMIGYSLLCGGAIIGMYAVQERERLARAIAE